MTQASDCLCVALDTPSLDGALALAQKLRGFEHCDAPKLYRHFVKGKGTVSFRNKTVVVTYPRRAHNPILRRVDWEKLPMSVPGLDADLQLEFK